MDDTRPQSHRQYLPLWNFWLAAAVWTALIGFSFVYNVHSTRSMMSQMALFEARRIFERNIASSHWEAGSLGLQLNFGSNALTQGRITSLKLVDEKNAPDVWERTSVERLSHGEVEIADVMTVDGFPYLRVMKPLVVTRRCLDCHSAQGYSEGEIRGGISVAVPLKSSQEIEARDQKASLLWHFIIYLVGLGGIIGGTISVQKKRRAHEFAREAQVSAERKLASQEQYLKAIVQGSPIAVVVLDLHQIIESCNEAFENIFGYSITEAVGKNLDDLIVPADRRTEAEQLTRSSNSDGRVHKELTCRRKDGSLVAVKVFAKSISINGLEVGVVAQYVDISEQKQSKENLQRERTLLRTLIDNLPDAIYAKDTSCRKTIANPADVHNMGLQSEADVLGKDDFDLFPKDVAEGFFADDQSVIQTGIPVLNREEYFIDAEGRKRWLETSKLPLKDERDKIIGIIGIGREITKRKNAEEALKHEKSVMEALMDNVPDSIYFKDRQCRLTKISRKMLNDLKMNDMSQVIGKTDVDLFGEEFGRKTLENDERLMAIGKPIVGLTESRKLEDGSFYWTSTTKVPLRDNSGQIVGLVGITREINEFMKAQEERERERNLLRTLIDNIPDYIYVKDRDGRFIVSNTAVVHQMGLASENELLGKTDFDFFPHDLAAKYYAEEQAIIQADKGIYNHEGPSVDASKEEKDRWVTTNKVILRDGQGSITGFVGIGRDITERKRAEEQIRSQLSIIEEQNLALTTANEKALEATKAKSAFLASMSHELRTPLNAIIGYSEMLDEEMGDNGDDRYRADVEKVRSAGKHLLGLINDILDLSKIESGKMELYLEEFDLKNVIGEVASMVQPLIAQNENTFVLTGNEESRLVRLDLTKVRQILFNLISNASKFTQNGTVSLEVASVPGDAAPRPAIRFRVSDTGIGITKEQEERLFKEFAQADGSTTRRYGGTGLGLAISKRFCEMMGGSIGIESSSSKGTTFVATLPQRIEEPHEGTIPITVPSIIADRVFPKKSCILIIDDDPGVLDLLTRYLTKEGYLTVAVSSGDEGLQRAREIIPLAIILDVVMPSKDGWAVLQEIKSDPALEDVPVVMHTMVDDKNFGLAVGASEYLTKPVDKEKILHVIQRLTPKVKRSYVLVVDDDSDARTTICRPIEKAGWEVRTADNGKSAIAILEKEIPGIIFLDLMMPVMDGFEFLAILQNKKEWTQIPVVIVTSKDLTIDERQRLNRSVMNVIQKGDLTPDKLLKQLTMLVPRMSQKP